MITVLCSWQGGNVNSVAVEAEGLKGKTCVQYLSVTGKQRAMQQHGYGPEGNDAYKYAI